MLASLISQVRTVRCSQLNGHSLCARSASFGVKHNAQCSMRYVPIGRAQRICIPEPLPATRAYIDVIRRANLDCNALIATARAREAQKRHLHCHNTIRRIGHDVDRLSRSSANRRSVTGWTFPLTPSIFCTKESAIRLRTALPPLATTSKVIPSTS